MDKVIINVNDEESVPQSRVEAVITDFVPFDPGGGGHVDPEDFRVQAKTAVSSTVRQTVEPDPNYNYLTKVTIEPIPITYTQDGNGTIVTIG